MNVASIDIGSNTVLLLIASVNKDSKYLDTVLNKYEIPRLGKGIDKSGNISDERIDMLLEILDDYTNLISDYKCEKLFCTATNAMRIAKNSQEIVDEVKEKFGIEIDIISGEREAELSFKGASSALPNEEKKIVLDIGGGSTEIIFGVNSELKFRKSFPVGAVNLTEKFTTTSLPKESDIEKMKSFIVETFAELSDVFEKKIPLIAVAGTPTTLSALNHNLTEYDHDIVEGSTLSSKKLSDFIDYFAQNTPNAILEKFGKIIKGREDVILAGSLILKHIIELTGNELCTVSGKGIRYGSIVEYLESL